MKFTKTIRQNIDLLEHAEFEEDGAEVRVFVRNQDSRLSDDTFPILTVSKSQRTDGWPIDVSRAIDTARLTPGEFVELVALVNEALIRADFGPILEDAELADRVESMERRLDALSQQIGGED